MRWELIIPLAMACGTATTRPLSNTVTSVRSVKPLCGFTELNTLDRAAWAVARNHIHKNYSEPRPPELPQPVGACELHAIGSPAKRYIVRDGNVDIAEITAKGTLLWVPEPNSDITVGTRGDVVLTNYPSNTYRISCGPRAFGTTCFFGAIGLETNWYYEFVVDGDLPAAIGDAAAREFFRHRILRGVYMLSRVD